MVEKPEPANSITNILPPTSTTTPTGRDLSLIFNRISSTSTTRAPYIAPTAPVLPDHDHGTPYHDPFQLTYPSLPTLRSSRRYTLRLERSGSAPSWFRSMDSIAFGTRPVVPGTRSLAISSHQASACLFRSASSPKRAAGQKLPRMDFTPLSNFPFVCALYGLHRRT